MTIPTSNYTSSITEEFPSLNRVYKVESGIQSRYYRDHLPLNANTQNGDFSSDYVEFNLDGNSQEFLEMNTLWLETKLKVVNEDASKYKCDDSINFIDGLGHRLLSQCSVYLNGTLCESNPYYGLENYIHTLLNMGKGDLFTIGRNMMYKPLDTSIVDVYDAENVKPKGDVETVMSNETKGEVHLAIPIRLNISSADRYLINGVSVRIRFDLAPASLLINNATGKAYKYKVNMFKLWSEKIVPHPEALLSLNTSLTYGSAKLEYIFTRPVVKTFILPTGQKSLSLDNMFNGNVVSSTNAEFPTYAANVIKLL